MFSRVNTASNCITTEEGRVLPGAPTKLPCQGSLVLLSVVATLLVTAVTKPWHSVKPRAMSVLESRDAAGFYVSDPPVNSPGRGIQAAKEGPEWRHTMNRVLPETGSNRSFSATSGSRALPKPGSGLPWGAQPHNQASLPQINLK